MIDPQNTAITKTQINTALSNCRFDPKDVTIPENVASRSDESYCSSRAVEAIQSGDFIYAIKMLALAEVKRCPQEK